MSKKQTLFFSMLGVVALVGAGSSFLFHEEAAATSQVQGPAQLSLKNTYSTIVDDKGNISLPRNVAAKWFHLGTFAVVNDGTDEGNGLHHVYTTADVVDHFNRTGEFADGSVLLKDVTGLNGADLTTGRSHWATDTQVWFIMVKDTKGRFQDNPLWGDGWGWALYNGGDLNKQVATDYKKDCLSCHVPVQDSDWVHTFAYPSINGGDATFIQAATTEAAPEMAAQTGGASAGDAAAGEQKFARCATCHAKVPGQNKLGPSLAGLIGRKAGAAPGFNYSPAMKDSDVIWTAETLDKHLLDVKGFIPGNRMGQLYPVGVPNDQDRADIIAYIETLPSE